MVLLSCGIRNHIGWHADRAHGITFCSVSGHDCALLLLRPSVCREGTQELDCSVGQPLNAEKVFSTVLNRLGARHGYQCA